MNPNTKLFQLNPSVVPWAPPVPASVSSVDLPPMPPDVVANRGEQPAVEHVIDLTKFGAHLVSDVSYYDENFGFSGEDLNKLRTLDKQVLENLRNIRKGATEVLGFDKAYSIQAKSVPYFLFPYSHSNRYNLIAQAQGGGGKTVAFVIGMLLNIDPNQHFTQALCLGLTRELAYQIKVDAVDPLSKFMNIRKLMLLNDYWHPDGAGPITDHLIVGTPGVVEAQIKAERLDLSRLRTFVLDEADEIVAQKGNLKATTFKIKNQGRFVFKSLKNDQSNFTSTSQPSLFYLCQTVLLN